MRFSEFAGVAVVPTLSRLVLALAFVTAGYNKLMIRSDFDASQKDVLESLGVEVTPKTESVAWNRSGARGVRASFVQDEPGTEPQDETDGQETEPPAAEPEPAPRPAQPAPQPEPEARPKVQPEPARQPERDAAPPPEPEREAPPEPAPPSAPVSPAAGAPQPTAPSEVAPAPTYTARSLYNVALLCHDAGWPRPRLLAWVAALTELIGGALMLVGLFSRVWGLGLSIAMGSALYLVSIRLNHVHATNPFELAQNFQVFPTLLVQLALFVLAFGILLTGPGPLSLDALFFKKRRHAAGGADGEGDHHEEPTRRPL